MLTNFTFETFPVKRAYVLVLGIWWFFLFLSQHPVLKALEVNETNCALAFTSDDQWIVVIFFGTPTNSTLNLVFSSFSTKILHSSHFLSFLEFLIVELTFTH